MVGKHKNWHKEWSRKGSFLVHTSGLRLEVIEGDGFADIETDDASLAMANDGSLQIDFDGAQRAVTPGQSVVLYADDICLGGAVIARTDAPCPDALTEAAA